MRRSKHYLIISFIFIIIFSFSSCGLFNKKEDPGNESFVKITSPQAGATINGFATIEVEVDENKIQIDDIYGYINFLIDGIKVDDSLICSYSVHLTFNTTAYDDGKHTIEVESDIDFPDTYVSRDKIEVNIDNQTSSYPEPKIIELDIKLLAEDGLDDDHFGQEVAISGDGSTIAIGAPYNDEIAADSGAVYIYSKFGNSWIQQAKLTPSDSEEGDLFGSTLSLNADGSLVTSLICRQDFSCFVYIFEKGVGWQNESLNQIAKLVVPDIVEAYGVFNDHIEDLYSQRICISPDGSTIVIAMECLWHMAMKTEQNLQKTISLKQSQDMFETNIFFIFEKNSAWEDGNNNITYPISSGKRPSTGISGDGITIAIGDTTVPWTYEHWMPSCDYDYSHYSNVMIITKADNNEWQPIAYLNTPDNNYFALGKDVSNSSDGSTIIVGAADSAYIYEKGNGWQSEYKNLAAKLIAFDNKTRRHFGSDTAISFDGSKVIIGAWVGIGSVYLYNMPKTGWITTAYYSVKFVAADSSLDDMFGYSIAMSSDGSIIVVGAWENDNTNGTDAGAVYVYEE